MRELKAISVKTQVRRLKYFSVFSEIIGKKGCNIELLRIMVDKWSDDHESDFQSYFSLTGEINQKKLNKATGRYERKNKITQSLKNYLDASKSLFLTSQEKGWIYPSRMMLILREATQNFNPLNAFALNNVEKVFFLYSLLLHDSDRLLSVYELIRDNPGQSLKEYQKDFKNHYLLFLEKKINQINTSSIVKEKYYEAYKRVKEWRSPERYSEDIVPPRINWWLDLGFINTKLFVENKVIISKHINQDFCSLEDTYFKNSILLIEGGNLSLWQNLEEEKKEKLVSFYLIRAKALFGVLNLPRLPLNDTMFFLCFKLFQKESIIADMSEIVNWIGFEKQINGVKLGIRKSGRSYESYLYLK
ncbi:MAG: hypothetical protein R2825_01320 [Saprospiraceae bacterium]